MSMSKIQKYKYNCLCCNDYRGTHKKSNWHKHIVSAKHLKNEKNYAPNNSVNNQQQLIETLQKQLEMKDKQIEPNDTKPDDVGGVRMDGHILIRDVTDKNKPVELVNKRNAIHYGNMARHLAHTLAGKENYEI